MLESDIPVTNEEKAIKKVYIHVNGYICLNLNALTSLCTHTQKILINEISKCNVRYRNNAIPRFSLVICHILLLFQSFTAISFEWLYIS